MEWDGIHVHVVSYKIIVEKRIRRSYPNIYIYIYIYMYVCMYIYIVCYIYNVLNNMYD